MAEFSYIVRDEKGYRQTGNISSDNYNSAVEKLQSDGLTIIKLIERDASFDFVKPFINRLSKIFCKIYSTIMSTSYNFMEF